jgi:hypothetical protein
MVKRKSIRDKTLAEVAEDIVYYYKKAGRGVRTTAGAIGTGTCAVGSGISSGTSWTYYNLLKPLAKPAFIGITGVALGLTILYGARSFNGKFNPDYNPNFPTAIYELDLSNEGHFAVIEQKNKNLTDFKTPGAGEYGRCQRLENIQAEEYQKAEEKYKAKSKKTEDDYKAKIDSINKQYDKLKGN